jgi:hypothetical protein
MSACPGSASTAGVDVPLRVKLEAVTPTDPYWRTMNSTSFRSRIRAFALAETGSATAEYAIATLAAVGFAGLLVVILRSDAVRSMLTNLIQHALSFSV